MKGEATFGEETMLGRCCSQYLGVNPQSETLSTIDGLNLRPTMCLCAPAVGGEDGNEDRRRRSGTKVQQRRIRRCS